MSKYSHVLTEIKDSTNMSYAELASQLGVTRQCLFNYYSGYRKMTREFEDKVRTLYPEFFNQTNAKNSVYKIPYCPKQQIPHNFDLFSSSFPTVTIDKQLINVDINENHCRIVTMSDDSLSPVYLKGDKIILDTSQTRLIDGLCYLISCKGVNYVRKVKILPNEVRCISTNDDRDTFICKNCDLVVIGLIVPNIRL